MGTKNLMKATLLMLLAVTVLKISSYFFWRLFGEEELGGFEKPVFLIFLFGLILRFYWLPKEINRILDEREKKTKGEF